MTSITKYNKHFTISLPVKTFKFSMIVLQNMIFL